MNQRRLKLGIMAGLVCIVLIAYLATTGKSNGWERSSGEKGKPAGETGSGKNPAEPKPDYGKEPAHDRNPDPLLVELHPSESSQIKWPPFICAVQEGCTGFLRKALSHNDTELDNAYVFRDTGGTDTKYVEFLLKGKYHELTGILFVNKSNYPRSDRGCLGKLTVVGDGKVLMTKEVWTAQTQPQDFSVSIAGVDKMRLEFVNSSNYGFGISELRLHTAGK